MKKRYEQELDKLSATYNWAFSAPIGQLCQFVLRSRNEPLISVGSGGSFAAAVLAAMLHEATGSVATSTTPFQLQYKKRILNTSSVLLLTASGKNQDILKAFRETAINEPKQLMALCTKQHSPLSRLASKFPSTNVQEYELPSGKDGFLATNSLLLLITLLVRAYSSCNKLSYNKPPNIFDAHNKLFEEDASKELFIERDNFIVLYGGWGLPAAVDLESRFVEGALGNVQIADYRNFAHGRHHWLAKRSANSAIIALISPDVTEIAQKTLDLIPENIPQLKLTSDCIGPYSSIEQIVKIMYLASIFGSKRRVALSKPGVPPFGQEIYHLRNSTKTPMLGHSGKLSQNAITAIQRKTNMPIELMSSEHVNYWRSAYRKFLRKLKAAEFTSIIFDYDGTLCDPSARFELLSNDICNHLRRLLRAGITIGIATGRGQSVRESLQEAIPKKYWAQVWIGYYNGSDIGLLSDNNQPDKDGPLHPTLLPIKSCLSEDTYFAKIATLQARPNQISINPVNGSWGLVHNWLFDIFGTSLSNGVQILESSHSFDILAVGVSKLNLFSTCKKFVKKTRRSDKILCIGDKGAWPGNDFELLSHKFSLSVDEVSADHNTCWNLTPPSYKGVKATIYYLESLKPTGLIGAAKLDLPTGRGKG